MNKSSILTLAGILLCLALLSTFFIVDEVHSAIVVQFGKPVKTITNAGFKTKIPFIQDVYYFDKRVLEWDGEAYQITTGDKKFIMVDTTARWRITDPLKYYQTVRDEDGAQKKLDDIIDSITREVVSKKALIELVRNTDQELQYSKEFSTQAELEKKLEDQAREKSLEDQKENKETNKQPDNSESELLPIKTGRQGITKIILEHSKRDAEDFGIDIIDILIKRVNYTPEVQQKVYDRMISERKKVAEKYRAEGEGEKAKILGLMQEEIKKITSNSYRQSEVIKGEGDALAAKIYADSYQQDPEFYTFVKALENYRKSIDEKTFFIFSTKNQYLKYIKSDE